MGQQYANQSRDCALQNCFTAYFQIALRRKKRDYTQKWLRQKAHEFLTDFQDAEFADDSDPGFDGNCQGYPQMGDGALSQALSSLTARERFILFERVLNGKKYSELAEVLGFRYSEVAVAYSRTIKKLRKKLRGGRK